MWTCRLMSSRAPNAPPDPAEREPHLLVRQAEAGGDLVAVLVQPLGGDVQLDAAVLGRARPARTRARGTPGPACRSRTCPRRPRRRLGAAGRRGAMHEWRRTLPSGWIGGSSVDGRLGVEERLEHLVVDDDRGAAPGGGLGVVGGDGGDRLADVADDVAREHRLVGGDQPVGRAAGHVVGGDDRVHAGDRQRRGDVDASDAGVRVRAAQRRAPQHAVGPQVGRERERALAPWRAVGPGRARRRRRPPGRRRAGRRRRARSRLIGQPPSLRPAAHGGEDPPVAGAAAEVARPAPRGSPRLARRPGCASSRSWAATISPACRSRTARRPRRRRPAARRCSSPVAVAPGPRR